MKQRIYNWLKENPKIKRHVLKIMIHPVKIRPRWWLRLFIPLYADMERGSVMYRSVRKDIAPFNKFCVGKCSVIEDYSIVNNLVGDIIVGDYSRVGFGNVIIGPVTIGSHVSLAQNITVTGLDHNYKDVKLRIDEQGVSTSLVLIEDDVWVGANSVITKGVTIGKHSVVAGGSLVNRDVPPYSIVAGNPAKVIKIYNPGTQAWEKVVTVG